VAGITTVDKIALVKDSGVTRAKILFAMRLGVQDCLAGRQPGSQES